VWDIITNKEAIQINQAWVGHPGSQVLANEGSNKQVEVWTKPLANSMTAVFVINTENKPSNFTHPHRHQHRYQSQQQQHHGGGAPGHRACANGINP
jgi:hypothetical protein